MIIENVVVSDELKDVYFRCPLDLCHGDCCVEGDAGAPLTEEEISMIEDLTETILPLMDEDGKKVMNDIGSFDYDMSGKMVTPLKPNEECIYLTWENGHTICVFEKLFNEDKIDFQKPISCHLYPIRVVEDGAFEKLLLHRWRICADAFIVGKKDGVRLLEFVKDPLIRKYGVQWYNRLMIKCGFDPHKTDQK